ncbi:MAG: hypothetical protein ACXVH6_04240 [Halobacteriota archaeon]
MLRETDKEQQQFVIDLLEGILGTSSADKEQTKAGMRAARATVKGMANAAPR